MAVRTDDITTLLKQQILNFKPTPSQIDVGEVIEVGDGIALVSGLTNVMSGELVEFTKTGVLGIALNLTAAQRRHHRHGRIPGDRGRRHRAQHGPHRLGACGRRPGRPCGERSGVSPSTAKAPSTPTSSATWSALPPA